jgi:hypothetical protein
MATIVITQQATSAWPTKSGASALGVVPGGLVGVKDDTGFVRYLDNRKIVSNIIPSSYDTHTIDDSAYNQHIQIEPAADLAALQLELPSDTNSIQGQEISVYCTKIVSSFTLIGAATIQGAPTSLTANSYFRMIKTGTDKWTRNG